MKTKQLLDEKLILVDGKFHPFNPLKTLDIQFFADEADPVDDNGGKDDLGDDGKGASDDLGDKGKSTDQDDPNNSGDDDQKGDKKSNKTFTQEDVNTIAAREAKKAQEKLLKQLGVKDVKSAKEGLEQFKQYLESQKTDAQKLEDKVKDYETTNTTLLQENNSLKAQLAAFKAGVKADSLDDVVVLANNLVSDEIELEDAIEQILTKYPHFKNEVQQQDEKKNKKPKFSDGDHKKDDKQDEASKWVNAFNFGGFNKQ